MQSIRWKSERLEPPLLIINYKNYAVAWGKGGVDLARLAERSSLAGKVRVAVAPAAPFLMYVSTRTRLPVLAQHLDTKPEGSTTGYLVGSAIKAAGCAGAILNHSEYKMTRRDVGRAVSILRRLGLKSVVCAESVVEASEMSRFQPDFIAVEPPELIGTGISVSTAKPHLIRETVEIVRKTSKGIHILCGAGITSGEDVKAALELGTEGVLVSSGIVLAEDWKRVLEEIIETLAEARLARKPSV